MSSPLPFDISLWDFSLYQYSRPGVSDICIALQDEEGVNVNVLLWSLWLGHKGFQLDIALLAQAIDAIQAWDKNYVIPLRQLRRNLKTEFGTDNVGVENIRTLIKQAELLAEKHLQNVLQTMMREEGSTTYFINRREFMFENLKCYLQSRGVGEPAVGALMALIE